MIVIMILIALVVAGVVIERYAFEMIGEMVLFISAITLVFVLVMIPINHIKINKNIHEYTAAQESICKASWNGEVLSSVAIQASIIKKNSWLEGVKYLNGTIFGLWVPDGIETLTPIEWNK